MGGLFRRWSEPALLLVLIGGVSVATYAWWGERQERKAAIATSNAIADTFSAIVDSLEGRIQERGRTAERATELAEYLETLLDEEVHGLVAEIRAANATIRSHTRTIGRLEAELESRAPVETLPDSSRLVVLNWVERYDASNFFEVTGDVLVPPEGDALLDLELDVGFSVDVLVSRGEDGALRCDADTHLPGALLTSLDCAESLEDPLTPRASLFEGLGLSDDGPLEVARDVAIFGLGLWLGSR